MPVCPELGAAAWAGVYLLPRHDADANVYGDAEDDREDNEKHDHCCFERSLCSCGVYGTETSRTAILVVVVGPTLTGLREC